MPLLKEKNLQGFDTPIDLPQTDKEARDWQEQNRLWWESHPMRYDWQEQIGSEEFSKEFYQEIDNRFFSDAESYLPAKHIPFDALIDFEALNSKDVLEIGVGNGSHAALLAKYSGSYTGIDLTNYAVTSTTKRLKLFGLKGLIRQMDAEQMDFADGSFDFIWSWGVIHHSSNTWQVLSEMNRVLRPGGQAIVMVYHRNFWNWYVANGLVHGVFRGQILETGSLHGVTQRWTDGAIARYYTIREWNQLASEFFHVNQAAIYGNKSDVILLPSGKVKQSVLSMVPNRWAQFFTHRCRMGGLLVAFMEKTR